MKNDKRRIPAKGHYIKAISAIQCVVIFDAETFDQIRERAMDHGTSFSEQIRLLCEWGLKPQTKVNDMRLAIFIEEISDHSEITIHDVDRNIAVKAKLYKYSVPMIPTKLIIGGEANAYDLIAFATSHINEFWHGVTSDANRDAIKKVP